MAMRIDVVDLDIYYGPVKAVEAVTMTVEPRSVTAVIGPSGCGKSTVLRALNRMHEVTPGACVEGTVLLDDQDVYARNVDPVAVRRYLGTKGVPAQRLTAYGFGSARLVEPGDPAAGSNRRVEIRKAPAS